MHWVLEEYGTESIPQVKRSNWFAFIFFLFKILFGREINLLTDIIKYNSGAFIA
jgi:uncharacterized membrane protein